MNLFPETLPSLFRALNHTGKKFEVIVVDDCSTDDSVAYLELNFPEILVLRNQKNSGFSVTINKGIFSATFELVLLLNSDVKLSEQYFENQFQYFLRPDTFGVMGKIIGWDDDIVQDSAKYPQFQGFKLKTSYNHSPEHTDNTISYSMYLSGANALVDRKKLLQLNGFDELFSPFYMEDVDLSIRAWRIGWKCYFDSKALCRHKTSTTIKSKEKKEYVRSIYNRNKMYFHAIHLNGIRLFGWYVQTMIELIFRILTLRIDYLKSFVFFLQNQKGVQRSRKVLLHLAQENQGLLSLNEVAEQIQRS